MTSYAAGPATLCNKADIIRNGPSGTVKAEWLDGPRAADRGEHMRVCKHQLKIGWNTRARLAATAMVLALITVAGLPAAAHEGHDHGGPKVEITTAVAPRFEALSTDFELVGVVKDNEVILTLDRFATNEAISDAAISATANGETVIVEPAPDNTYRLRTPLLSRPGRIEFVFTIAAGETTDLLAGSLEAIAPVVPDRNTSQGFGDLIEAYRLPLLMGAGGIMFGALSVLLFRVRGPRTSTRPPELVETADADAVTAKSKVRRIGAIIAGVATMALTTSLDVRADASKTPSKLQVTITADLPQRLPDGSLFVPKETQRLLTIRTVLAGASNAARTAQLSGQIVADPNGFGRVQSPVNGRIEAAEGGLPFVGKTVEKGQALAFVVPIVATEDQNSYASTVGELDTQVALAEAKLARIARIPGAVPQKDIDDTRTELDGLRKRRADVRSSQSERQVLTAPISGVISLSTAVPGQLASARDTIFEIVDPARLWVEAIAFAPSLVDDILDASAVTTTGETFKLALVGRSLTLRQQGTPVTFQIDAPTRVLAIGRPMTVILKTRSNRDGMILPQASVVRGANGVAIVWTHIAAERFKPNVVKYQSLDGARVVIEGGLKPNERVVIEGATLLNQIR